MVDLNNQTASDLSFNASPISGGALQEGLGLSAPSPAPKPEAQPALSAPTGLTPEQTMQKSYEDVGEKQADILRQRTQGAAGASRQYASDIGGQYKAAEAQYQKPEQFKPTEEDAKSLMSLFGAISVMGAFMGGKGQLGGIGAMNAMSGMVNGYTQGRKDLFDREKAKYDAGMKVMQEHNNQIDRILKNGLEKAKVNYASAQAEVESQLGAMGADLIKAQARQSGIVETAKHFEQAKAKAEQARLNEIRIKTMEAKLAGGGGSTAKGVLAQQFEAQMAISANEAAAQIQTLADLPLTTGGMFGQAVSKGIFDAPIGALANTLTTDDAQRYNSVIAATGYEAAKLAGGGRAVSKSQQENFASRFYIKSGDAGITVLQKLANMRQTFERAMDVLIKTAPPDLKQVYANGIKEIQDAIPITTEMVAKATREAQIAKGKKTSKTFADFMRESSLETRPNAATPAAPNAATPAAPNAATPAAPNVTSPQESENKKAAREAISNGASRELVIKRLKDAGEDVTGL